MIQIMQITVPKKYIYSGIIYGTKSSFPVDDTATCWNEASHSETKTLTDTEQHK